MFPLDNPSAVRICLLTPILTQCHRVNCFKDTYFNPVPSGSIFDTVYPCIVRICLMYLTLHHRVLNQMIQFIYPSDFKLRGPTIEAGLVILVVLSFLYASSNFFLSDKIFLSLMSAFFPKRISTFLV